MAVWWDRARANGDSAFFATPEMCFVARPCCFFFGDDKRLHSHPKNVTRRPTINLATGRRIERGLSPNVEMAPLTNNMMRAFEMQQIHKHLRLRPEWAALSFLLRRVLDLQHMKLINYALKRETGMFKTENLGCCFRDNIMKCCYEMEIRSCMRAIQCINNEIENISQKRFSQMCTRARYVAHAEMYVIFERQSMFWRLSEFHCSSRSQMEIDLWMQQA